MANARSLAAVFFEATRYACRFHVHDKPTLAERLHQRLVDAARHRQRGGPSRRPSTRSATTIRGRTLGPPIADLVKLLCAGDRQPLGRFIEDVKAGARARVGAANYLATFLLFAKAAGVSNVLLGCDQLEDFAATSTTKAEADRRDRALPRLRPRAAADGRHADRRCHAAPARRAGYRRDVAPGRPAQLRSRSRRERVPRGRPARDRRPRRVHARCSSPTSTPRGRHPRRPQPIAPFTEEAIDVLLSRSDGKPRDLLRKAFALIDHGATKNWDQIDRRSRRRRPRQPRQLPTIRLRARRTAARRRWRSSGRDSHAPIGVSRRSARELYRLAQEDDTDTRPGTRMAMGAAHRRRTRRAGVPDSEPSPAASRSTACCPPPAYATRSTPRSAARRASHRRMEGLSRTRPQERAPALQGRHGRPLRCHGTPLCPASLSCDSSASAATPAQSCAGTPPATASPSSNDRRWPAPVLADPDLPWPDGAAPTGPTSAAYGGCRARCSRSTHSCRMDRYDYPRHCQNQRSRPCSRCRTGGQPACGPHSTPTRAPSSGTQPT